jgi:hypothetical protein
MKSVGKGFGYRVIFVNTRQHVILKRSQQSEELSDGMRNVSPPIRYKVSKPLQAVKLAEHPGSSLRDPTGTLVQIPAEVIIEVEGGVADSGLINILWNGDVFSVFHEDLQEKAGPVSAAEV